MNREPFLRCLWDDLQDGHDSRLLKLVPKEMRRSARGASMDDEMLQYMSSLLCNCEDLELQCECSICLQNIEQGSLFLPQCNITKTALLSQVMAEFASDFDPERYSPGDISRVVTARHCEALRAQRSKRKAAHQVVNDAVRRRDRHMHQEAAKKKTQRIEGLRDSMGAEAFASMVQQQVEARRSKFANASLSSSTRPSHFGSSGLGPPGCCPQTWQWWQSTEGWVYRQGPPCPDPVVVAEHFVPKKGNLLASVLQTLNLRQRSEAQALLSGEAVDPVVLQVPLGRVAAFARIAAEWIDQQELKHTTTVSVKVDFDRAAGERVPRVHVTGKCGRPQELALLDAASLAAVMPGTFISGVRRLVTVNDRIVATTGKEKVALALPRPHDQFDVLLRGKRPPTSELPVGWDVTNAAVEADMHIIWNALPHSELRLSIVACEGADEAAANQKLIEHMTLHVAPAAQLVKEQQLLADYRQQRQAERRKAIWAIARWPFQKLYAGAGSLWKILKPILKAVRDYVLTPLKRGGAALLRKAWRAVSQAASWSWKKCVALIGEKCGQVLRFIGRAISKAAKWSRDDCFIPVAKKIGQALKTCWRVACKPTYDALKAATKNVGKKVSQALKTCWRVVGKPTCDAIKTAARKVGGKADQALRSSWRASCTAAKGSKKLTCKAWTAVGKPTCDFFKTTAKKGSDWWASEPLLRRAACSLAVRVKAASDSSMTAVQAFCRSAARATKTVSTPVGNTVAKAWAPVGAACGRARKACGTQWRRLFARQPVALARARRHDERHALS